MSNVGTGLSTSLMSYFTYVQQQRTNHVLSIHNINHNNHNHNMAGEIQKVKSQDLMSFTLIRKFANVCFLSEQRTV